MTLPSFVIFLSLWAIILLLFSVVQVCFVQSNKSNISLTYLVLVGKPILKAQDQQMAIQTNSHLIESTKD